VRGKFVAFSREGLRVLRKEIFGLKEWDEPWMKKLRENGGFVSIKNLVRFIRVGITHCESVI